MHESPVQGLKVPLEKNPLRPVMTQGRYEGLLAEAEQVTYEILAPQTTEDGKRKRKRKRVQVRSYLPELLVLANETGRRISAILGLTYEDLDTERRSTAPHGSITWRADLDKKRREWPNVPITAAARTALDRVLRDRPGDRAGPAVPLPKGPHEASQPLAR